MYAVVEAMSTNNQEEIKTRIDDYRARKQKNEELWKMYMATSMDAEEKKLADDFEKDYNDMISQFEEFVSAVQGNDLITRDKVLVTWLGVYRSARDKMDKIIQFQIVSGEKMIAVNKKNSANTKRTLYIILAVSVFSGIFITILLARSVSGPVGKGLEFAKKIAEGDFTDRIDLDQKDELGQLGFALNAAADNLEKMVADIISNSQNLVQAIQEISSGNENLSQRTSEQASSLEEVASTIEETTASINQNAENSKNANELAVKTTSMAEDGGRTVSDAVNAINEINESSKKIEAIITVINDISFQTNLLALNAAVEAARAGEQGRGFAVVAGEVRNLAQRSGSAAKEIAELIKTTIQKVEKGTNLANQSGVALKEIIGSVRNVGRFVSEIDAASEEQKQGASQINIAVSELDSMTQQNAGLVEETASASEEIANQAQELLSMMEKFKIRTDIKDNSFSSKHREIHLHSNDKSQKIQKKSSALMKNKPVVHTDHAASAKLASADSQAASGGDKSHIDKLLSQDGFEQF